MAGKNQAALTVCVQTKVIFPFKGALTSIFSLIAIELNVLRDDFSSIAIELRARCASTLSSIAIELKFDGQRALTFITLGHGFLDLVRSRSN